MPTPKQLQNNWYAWTTLNEIKFLAGLGQWTAPHHVPFLPRRDLLRNYLSSMDARDNYGQIDKDVIRATVTAMLVEYD